MEKPRIPVKRHKKAVNSSVPSPRHDQDAPQASLPKQQVELRLRRRQTSVCIIRHGVPWRPHHESGLHGFGRAHQATLAGSRCARDSFAWADVFGCVRSATWSLTPCKLFSLCCNCKMSRELFLSGQAVVCEVALLFRPALGYRPRDGHEHCSPG